jgi:pimeloyl-ACP methyl ester carboxylesterase
LAYTRGDVVILLPGILGSVLTRNGREVWAQSASALFRALKSGGESIQDISLSGDDPKAETLDDGVAAPRLIRDLTIIPGFWKIDGYTAVTKSVVDHFGLTGGQDFFEFPYDWRRCNSAAAFRLQRGIHGWLKAQKEAGVPDPKAILLAHSMGGLVSRYYLEVLGGWRDTRFLVTFGTPYRGSLNALDNIVNGSRFAGLDVSPFLRTLTSLYQLLPTYPCISKDGASLTRVTETSSLPWLDPDHAQAALDFHHAIFDQQAINATLPGYGYRTIPMVGFEQPTSQSARFHLGTMEMLRTLDGKDDSGDGTVPFISSMPPELLNSNQEIFASEKHASLQNHDFLLTQLRGALQRPVITGPFRRASTFPLSVEAADAYSSKQEIEIGIKASEGRPRMEAILQKADTGVEVQRAEVRVGGGWGQRVIFSPVAEGLYRYRIQGDEVSPLTDVFMVADDL